jgi:hypothetical protein
MYSDQRGRRSERCSARRVSDLINDAVIMLRPSADAVTHLASNKLFVETGNLRGCQA